MAFFLGFLVLTTIFLPMVTLSRLGRISLALVFVLTLVAGALATIEHTLLKYLVIGLTLTNLVVGLVGEFRGAGRFLLLETCLGLTCLSVMVLMTLKRTISPGPVTKYRIMGGIAAYLLLGYTWAFGYQLLVQTDPGAIRFENAPPVGVSKQQNALIYFSFITLTTVGYGDVHPVHPMVRSLAVAEALAGQLYLAILIASLVGMALQARSSEEGIPVGPNRAAPYPTKSARETLT